MSPSNNFEIMYTDALALNYINCKWSNIAYLHPKIYGNFCLDEGHLTAHLTPWSSETQLPARCMFCTETGTELRCNAEIKKFSALLQLVSLWLWRLVWNFAWDIHDTHWWVKKYE